MFFQLKSYLHFLWLSKNEHGVHSPFVFTLVTQCFYDKAKHADYAVLNQYRSSLLADKNAIEVTDFGAGSRVFKSTTRSIAQIAATAGISKKRAQLLYRIIRYFEPHSILELGTSVGLATASMVLGNKKAQITTLEGCPETGKIAKNQFKNFHFHQIEAITTRFEDFLQEEQLAAKKYDLIYFDGNHAKEATAGYFEQLLPTTHNETVWIFDDIHWSKEMQEAWAMIQNHPKVTVTIDTHQWGLIFFRKEQAKEHFVIRI